MSSYAGDIILDFETRSRVDLKTTGAYNYALDPSTEILCMAVLSADPDDDTARLWEPRFESLPKAIFKMLRDARRIIAHNAKFDQLIYECIAVDDWGFPERKAIDWLCSSATARVNAMPASLDELTRALDSSVKKDFTGAALIRQLCIPQKDGTFDVDPEAMARLGEYCLTDVRATKAALHMLRPMGEDEIADWHVNEKINDHGVKIDYELAELAQQYAAAEQSEISDELTKLTNGRVTKHTQSKRVRNWLLDVCPDPEIKRIMTVYKKGEKKLSLDKAVRADLLNASSLRVEDKYRLDIPEHVREVLKAVDAGNKSSVSKFKTMMTRADLETDRVQGPFVYAGASQTLRFASRGLQLHNMRRDTFKPDETERLKDIMRHGGTLVDVTGETLPVMDTLSKLLRPALIPEKGHKFVVGDWSAIEARVLPWLANSRSAEKKLDLFRQGVDTYIQSAKDMGIGDPEGAGRQAGKVSELAFGFGGAKGSFNAMSRNYGLHLPEWRVQELVDLWRANNAWAVRFWNQLQDAAMKAVSTPGEAFDAGRVTYAFYPDFIEGTLLAIMPGDLVIQYPKAKIEVLETPYGRRKCLTAMKASYSPAAGETEWPRINLWRGLLAENATQAFAGRILRHALGRMQHVVGHVHDEIIQEVRSLYAGATAELTQQIMEKVPEWAEGLPLKATPVIMERYGK